MRLIKRAASRRNMASSVILTHCSREKRGEGRARLHLDVDFGVRWRRCRPPTPLRKGRKGEPLRYRTHAPAILLKGERMLSSPPLTAMPQQEISQPSSRPRPPPAARRPLPPQFRRRQREREGSPPRPMSTAASALRGKRRK